MLLYQIINTVLSASSAIIVFVLTCKAINITKRAQFLTLVLASSFFCYYICSYVINMGMARLPFMFISTTVPMLMYAAASFKRTVLWSVVTILASAVSEVMLMVIWLLAYDRSTYAQMFTVKYQPYSMMIIGKLLVCLMTAITIIPIFHLWMKTVNKSSESDVTWFAIFPVSQLVQIYILYIYAKNDTSSNGFILCAICGVICIMADCYLFAGIKRLNQKRFLEQENIALQNQMRMQFEYYEQLRNNMDLLNKMRHDFRNQLQTAYILIGQNGAEKAREQLDLLSEWSTGGSRVQFCENPVIDALMQSKNHACRDKGISLNADIRIDEQAPIDGVSLCSLFANILDNAIEACNKLSDSAIRKIDISCKAAQGFFTLKCVNTCAETKKIVAISKNSVIAQHGI